LKPEVTKEFGSVEVKKKSRRGPDPKAAAPKGSVSVGKTAMTEQFSTFMQLSSALTGEKTLPEDLGRAYFERTKKNLNQGLADLLDKFSELVRSGKDPEAAIRENIFPDAGLGPGAKIVLLLWYNGGIKVGGDWELESADQFYRALVWEAIGAHPPTLSNAYYGHWKYPPEQ